MNRIEWGYLIDKIELEAKESIRISEGEVRRKYISISHHLKGFSVVFGTDDFSFFLKPDFETIEEAQGQAESLAIALATISRLED